MTINPHSNPFPFPSSSSSSSNIGNKSDIEKPDVNVKKSDTTKKVESVSRNISRNEELAVSDSIGQQLLNVACEKGNLEAVKKIIGSGIDPNKLDKNGWAPMHYAARAGQEEIIVYLLNLEKPDTKKPVINLRNKTFPEADIAYDLAIKSGNENCINLLRIATVLYAGSSFRMGSVRFGMNGEVTILSDVGAGLFAELKRVMHNILYFEKQKGIKKISVDWTQPLFPYKRNADECSQSLREDVKKDHWQDENGWDLYFRPIELSNSTLAEQKPQAPSFDIAGVLHNFRCIDEPWNSYNEQEQYNHRELVSQKMGQYIRIQPEILDEAQKFYEKHMEGHRCVGFHIRYSAAHAVEMSGGKNVSLEDYIEEAEMLLKKDPKIKIFIATDSQVVIEKFNKYFDDKHLNKNQLLYSNAPRSKDDSEPHLIWGKEEEYKKELEQFHAKKPGYTGGKMTIIDVLLLSKCEKFVHSASNIAFFVTYVNPKIESTFLPKRAEGACKHCPVAKPQVQEKIEKKEEKES